MLFIYFFFHFLLNHIHFVFIIIFKKKKRSKKAFVYFVQINMHLCCKFTKAYVKPQFYFYSFNYNTKLRLNHYE